MAGYNLAFTLNPEQFSVLEAYRKKHYKPDISPDRYAKKLLIAILTIDIDGDNPIHWMERHPIKAAIAIDGAVNAIDAKTDATTVNEQTTGDN